MENEVKVEQPVNNQQTVSQDSVQSQAKQVKPKKKGHGPLYWIIVVAGVAFIVYMSMQIGEKLGRLAELESGSNKSSNEVTESNSNNESNVIEESNSNSNVIEDTKVTGNDYYKYVEGAAFDETKIVEIVAKNNLVYEASTDDKENGKTVVIENGRVIITKTASGEKYTVENITNAKSLYELSFGCSINSNTYAVLTTDGKVYITGPNVAYSKMDIQTFAKDFKLVEGANNVTKVLLVSKTARTDEPYTGGASSCVKFLGLENSEGKKMYFQTMFAIE